MYLTGFAGLLGGGLGGGVGQHVLEEGSHPINIEIWIDRHIDI